METRNPAGTIRRAQVDALADAEPERPAAVPMARAATAEEAMPKHLMIPPPDASGLTTGRS